MAVSGPEHPSGGRGGRQRCDHASLGAGGNDLGRTTVAGVATLAGASVKRLDVKAGVCSANSQNPACGVADLLGQVQGAVLVAVRREGV